MSGDDDAAAEREKERAARTGIDRADRPARAVEKHAREDAAGEPAGDAAADDEEPVVRAGDGRRGGAEIGVVADDAERGEAGDDDRVEHEAVGALLERAAHLLDREHDAGERRVEGGRDAGGRAGEDEPALMVHAAERARPGA